MLATLQMHVEMLVEMFEMEIVQQKGMSCTRLLLPFFWTISISNNSRRPNEDFGKRNSVSGVCFC